MTSFTIKDLENLSGIKAHTIRIWEQRYSFLKPQRTDTNIRYYSNDELKTILNIALLNKYGFKISHIDKMNQDEINLKLQSLTDSTAQQERIINNLIASMVDMDMERFEEIVDQQIALKGVERVIQNTLFPFLERIGILWQTDHINPAQEHLVTNIIRQKIIVGIETVRPHTTINKTFLLFLPETEYHEIGLLYLYFILKSKGFQVVYLGSNVPHKDVAYIARLKKPDFMFSHVTGAGPSGRLEKYFFHLREQTAGIPYLVSGQVIYQHIKFPVDVQIKRSLAEVMEFINKESLPVYN